MKQKKTMQKILTYILAGGATLAVGFLSMAGMFLLSSSLLLCGGAFILASAFEGQVNTEGVRKALRRLLTKDYLKKELLRKYLDNFIEQEEEYNKQLSFIEKREKEKLKNEALIKDNGNDLKINNLMIASEKDNKNIPQKIITISEKNKKTLSQKIISIQNDISKAKKRSEELKLSINIVTNKFLIDYKLQKKYCDDLEKQHEALHKKHDAIMFYEKEKRSLVKKQMDEQHEALHNAKARLKKIEMFVLNQLENKNLNLNKSSVMQPAVEALLATDRDALLKEYIRKKWIIRLGALLSLGGGVSCFFATFNAMQISIAAMSVLSVIPGGVLITLSILAAAGYAMLLYQSISDMVQTYSGKWRDYLDKRTDESTFKHIIRCTGIVLAIVVGVFATITTAGTWWYAAKNGAAILKIGNTAANLIRDISISMMTLPAIAFASYNSVAAIDDISKSEYKLLAKEAYKEIITNNRFFNIFAFLEKVITYTAKGVLFLGHIVSIGIMSDNCKPFPAEFSIAVNSVSEAATDINYLPNSKHQHNHESIGLKILYFPIVLVVGILKCLATAWDWVASGFASFSDSKQRMFPSNEEGSTNIKIDEPKLADEWGNVQLNLKRLPALSIIDSKESFSPHRGDNKNSSTTSTDSTTPFSQNPNTLFENKRRQTSPSSDRIPIQPKTSYGM